MSPETIHFTAQTPENKLMDLSNQLFEIDTKIKEIKRAQQTFDGTLEQTAYKGIVEPPRPVTVGELLNAMTPAEEMVSLTKEAIGIIQKMKTLDPSVHLPVFDEYSF